MAPDYDDCVVNPFKPNEISLFYRLARPISVKELLGGIFHFYSNFKRNFLMQTVMNLIRRRVLLCAVIQNIYIQSDIS